MKYFRFWLSLAYSLFIILKRLLKRKARVLLGQPLPTVEPQDVPMPETQDKSTQTLFGHLFFHRRDRLSSFYSHINGNNSSTQVDHESPEESVPTKDASVGNDYNVPHFFGFETVKQRDALKEFTGVDLETFEFLLVTLSDFKPRVYNLRDMLLVFLAKLKTGLSFSQLATIFNMCQSTLRSNFFAILDKLYKRTKPLVFWPSREKINKTMPNCFKKDFPNCRVIIDCTEIKCEKPSKIKKQNALYSHYKSSHTLKFLIGNLNLEIVITIIIYF